MLYKHQQDLLDKNPAKHILMWGTGTGKTRASIELATKNLADGNCLIICPKMLKENWARNIPSDRFHILSKEEFKKLAPTLPFYRCVIIDEAHNHSGYQSQLHKATVSYLKRHSVPHVYCLTATPFSNPWSVYAFTHIMGRPIKYPTFKATFFYEIRMGHRYIPKPRTDRNSELVEILHLFGSTVKLEDCIDMPESVYKTEWFTLTDDQHKLIENNYDPLPVVRFTKEHQICGGTLKATEYTDAVTIDCPKTDRLIELVKEQPRSIVVCRYLHEMTHLQEQLGNIRPTHIISGQTKDRDALIQTLQQSSNYCLLVQAQCSEGWELSECPVVIFYSMSWRYVDRIQLEGRIRRINNPKRNLYITLVVKDSTDEAVYNAIERKQDFQVELYEGTKFSDSVNALGKVQPRS